MSPFAPLPSLLSRDPAPGSDGPADGRVERLVQQAYPDLHRLAQALLSRERRPHTLQPTALVHEAFLRMSKQERAQFSDETHFLRVAAAMMRRILVNHERDRRRLKRGGEASKVELVDVAESPSGEPIDFVALDEALNRLELIDRRKVDLVQLRYFAGLTLAETARALGLSLTHVKREWALARAWLQRALTEG